MPILSYNIIISENSTALSQAVSTGSYAPVGGVVTGPGYALQAVGMGVVESGPTSEYEVVQGDSPEDLVPLVNAKITAGLQPVGGVVRWHNAFIQVVAKVIGGSGGSTSWASITDKPAVIGAGATQAAARTAIGAGTSNVAVGATVPVGPVAVAVPGASAEAARADHAHAFPVQFATGRILSVSGGATGSSTAFNGANNANIPVTLATPTTTVRGGVLQVATPVIDVTDPADPTNLEAQFALITNALKAAGVFS